jgi:hypothetical protein
VNTEADTCRKFVVPRLQTAGWEGAPHAINGQRTFTDNSTARRLLFMLLVLERESHDLDAVRSAARRLDRDFL